MQTTNVLIFGYGNPSRGDDALGPLLLESLGQHGCYPDVELLTDFQLQVEHALDLEGRSMALFIDAHLACRSPFEFTELRPACDLSYTTHAMSPAAVLQVYCEIIGTAPPPSFLLSIRGQSFALEEGLTPVAQQHLSAALSFVRGLCAQPEPPHWQGLAHTAEGGSFMPWLESLA